MRKIFLSIIFLILFSEIKSQESVKARALAEIIQVLTATETSQLNFGRFSPETQGGKIVLSSDGVRTSEGSIILVSSLYNSGSFYLTGEYDATFTITLPSAPEYIENDVSHKTMKIDNWRTYSVNDNSGIYKLDKGSAIVRVGADLNVGNMIENPVGIYRGTYSITFSYN